MKRTKIYGAWSALRSRCNNPNSAKYKIYGGRGIKCLWDTFESFYDDMFESFNAHILKYGAFQTTLDRIDVNGNYCKENCRWATRDEQSWNKRLTIRVEYKGEKIDVKTLGKKLGVKPATLRARLYRGWSQEDILKPLITRNYGK